MFGRAILIEITEIRIA